MTKYILHGGNTNPEIGKNKEFIQEILSGFTGAVKVLLVYFARPENEWSTLFEQDRQAFINQAQGRNIQLFITHSDIIFRTIIKEVDIIYVRGGKDMQQLELATPDPTTFKELLEGKVYVGSSAGAYLVSRYYYSGSSNMVLEGMGLIPVKICAHWGPDRIKAVDMLKKTGEHIPILTIAEGEYNVSEY